MSNRFKFCAAALVAVALHAGNAANAADNPFTLRVPLDSTSAVSCAQETALGDFLADGLRKTTGADVGLLPCGDITGNRQYAVGATFGPAEVAAEIATERQTVVVEVTGEQLLGLMEQALAALPQSSPKFLQFSGIRLKADLSQPAGGRVTQLTVQGSALDLTRTYTAAVTDTMVTGDAAPLKTAKATSRPATPTRGDMGALIMKTGAKDIKLLGRINILK